MHHYLRDDYSIPLRGNVPVNISFRKPNKLLKEFINNAVVLRTAIVLRTDDDGFTINFSGLGQERKERLWKGLVYDSQNETD